MKWPFEKRAAQSATDTTLAVLINATRAAPCKVAATGAAQTAALCWARALSGAEISGAEIPPQIMFDLGRDLVLTGESLFEISTANGQLEIAPRRQLDRGRVG